MRACSSYTLSSVPPRSHSFRCHCCWIPTMTTRSWMLMMMNHQRCLSLHELYEPVLQRASQLSLRVSRPAVSEQHSRKNMIKVLQHRMKVTPGRRTTRLRCRSASAWMSHPSRLLIAVAAACSSGYVVSTARKNLRLMPRLPSRVETHTRSKFVRLQKFWVTAIVSSRFNTACHLHTQGARHHFHTPHARRSMLVSTPCTGGKLTILQARKWFHPGIAQTQ